MKLREIPIDRVREVLWYEPWTGDFYWRVKTGDKCVVGAKAGSVSPRRDVLIGVDGLVYPGHRLAWAWMTGTQPPNVLDHKNMNTWDNRWENLRAATGTENNANRAAQSNHKTGGTKGVYHYPHLPRRPWLARLQSQGVIRLNRYFATQEEAAAAYAEAAKQWFGEFARTE